MKVPNEKDPGDCHRISLSRLQNEGSQQWDEQETRIGKSIKATE